MKIGVVSDTHSLLLPPVLLKEFKAVDLIIHAGDICDAETLKMLKSLAPIKAVQGNMDDLALKKLLPMKDIIACEGINIGVAHGHVGETRDALANVKLLFKNDNVDVVIFGHSHKALNEKIGKTLFFNPGSPNDVVRAEFFSYGILEIDKGKLKAKIVKF